VDVTQLRLQHQRLTAAGFATPEAVVAWLGAVQAQEYPGAKWGLALRMRRPTNAAIERAFADGRILRTHVMRPTWHFVTPDDIRWMLALTAPQVKARMAPYNRRLELDAAVFRRSTKAIAKALRDGSQLTRQELKAVLQRAGIACEANGVQRLAHIVMEAELDAVICSGVPRGRHLTYALLDERVPRGRLLPRDEALAELARRYFVSHGPAQLRDFSWWSGLSAKDSRRGVEMVRDQLREDAVDGKTCWSSPVTPRQSGRAPRAFLLPTYDEYLIAYKDRSAMIDPARQPGAGFPDPFSAPLVLDGRVIGTWRRAPSDAPVEFKFFRRPAKSDMHAIAEATERYETFSS
jgi:hypothetical protein